MRLVRVRQLDCYNFGRTYRPETKGPHPAIRFKGTAPYIGSVLSTAAIYICTSYYWLGVDSVNLYSGAGQHDCEVSDIVAAFEFNAICQSEVVYPVIYHERHLHRPQP